MYRIICNWCKLTKINFSVITEIFLICTYIFNFRKILAAINDFYKFTLKSQWKFIDELNQIGIKIDMYRQEYRFTPAFAFIQAV